MYGQYDGHTPPGSSKLMAESICPVIEERISAPLTRYMELRQTLAAEIAAGAFAVGAKFPTEYELCGRFNVSRHTVREALRALEDTGLLARQAGLGTTVLAHTPAAHYTSTLDSLGGLHDYATETAFEKQNE